MKKLISLLLLALALTFAGCGAPAQTPAEPAPAAAEEPAAESVEAVPAQEPEAVPGTETEAQAAEETPESTTLVVYFSATGTTRSVAERIRALHGRGSELWRPLDARNRRAERPRRPSRDCERDFS